jgi:hypothetical protein
MKKGQIDLLAFKTAKMVARKFSQLLRKEMQADLDIAIKRNRAERDHGVCHTHDFCDANMVMDAAMRACGIDPDKAKDEDGEPIEPFDAEFTALWNEAWNIAKGAEFDPKRIK